MKLTISRDVNKRMKKAHKLDESEEDNWAYAAITFPATIAMDYG